MAKISQGFLLLVALIVVASVVMAQDFNTECSDALGLMHDEVTSYMKQLDEADASADVTAWMTTAHEMRFFLATMDGYCRGYQWSSEFDGQMPVIGPVQFQDGLYRATVATDGYYIMSVETIEGECEPRLGSSIFNLSEGEASQGAQATFRATGCTALLEVSNVTDEWSVSFELISTGN